MKKNFFWSSLKNFTKKRCFIEIFEIIPFDYFSQIVLIEGRTKIKKRKFWPYFPQIVLIEGVLIDRNHSSRSYLTFQLIFHHQIYVICKKNNT